MMERTHEKGGLENHLFWIQVQTLPGDSAGPRIRLLNVLSQIHTPHVSPHVSTCSGQVEHLYCHWTTHAEEPKDACFLCVDFNRNCITRGIIEFSWWCSKGCSRKPTIPNDTELVGQGSVQDLTPPKTEGRISQEKRFEVHCALQTAVHSSPVPKGNSKLLFWGAEPTSC